MRKNIKPNFRVKHPYAYLINSILLGIIMLFAGIFSVNLYQFTNTNNQTNAASTSDYNDGNIHAFILNNTNFQKKEFYTAPSGSGTALSDGSTASSQGIFLNAYATSGTATKYSFTVAFSCLMSKSLSSFFITFQILNFY